MSTRTQFPVRIKDGDPVKIMGLTTEVSRNARMSNSRVGAECMVLGSAKLINAVMTDSAMIIDEAKLEDSMMSYWSKLTGNARAKMSYLGGSSWGSGDAYIALTQMFNTSQVMDQASVVNSIIYGRAIISDHAKVENSRIGGNVVVTGTAEIKGLELEDEEYMTEGVWTRKPYHVTSTQLGLPLGITESIEDRWTIGCTTYSYNFWMRHLEMLAFATGLSWDQVNQYAEALKNARDDRDAKYKPLYKYEDENLEGSRD